MPYCSMPTFVADVHITTEFTVQCLLCAHFLIKRNVGAVEEGSPSREVFELGLWINNLEVLVPSDHRRNQEFSADLH